MISARASPCWKVIWWPSGSELSEKFMGEDFVYDGDRRSMLVIGGAEKTAANQRNAHGFQIVRLDDVADGPVHVVFAGGLGLIVQPEKLLVIRAQRNCSPGRGHCLHSRRRREIFAARRGKPSESRRGLASLIVGAQRNAEDQDIMRIETRLNIPKMRKRAAHQSRADQQHQGHGHFENDKNTLRAMARAAGAAAAFLERIRQK